MLGPLVTDHKTTESYSNFGLDSRARAVPTPPLLSRGYWEEQRSGAAATAWQPLSPNAAEQALFRPASAFRARIGRKVRKG